MPLPTAPSPWTRSSATSASEVAAMICGLTDRWQGHAGALSRAQSSGARLERLAAESTQVQTVKLADDLARLRQVHLLEPQLRDALLAEATLRGRATAAGGFAGALSGACGARALDRFGQDAAARARDHGFAARRAHALAGGDSCFEGALPVDGQERCDPPPGPGAPWRRRRRDWRAAQPALRPRPRMIVALLGQIQPLRPG